MKLSRYFLLLLAFIPLLYFRDFTPNNELRYLSIANEALQNGHLFAFYNHGLPYADKPPLYFWIIMLGKYLLGFHSMLYIGLFSLVPALIVLYTMDKWTGELKPYSRASGSLMLMTSGLFVGSAIVLRMDMLMCMFIVLSLYTFFKLYTQTARPRDKFLLPFYIFMGLFTKGPVGLIMPILSIAGFLLLKKELKTFGRYMKGPEWLILPGLAICWFLGVYLEGGEEYLDNLLFNQTINRAVDSFHHKEPFWYYLKTIWYSLAPWALFYITVIILAIRQKRLKGDIEKFFLATILFTFGMLSVFSSKLDIYLLPTFPFFAYLSVRVVSGMKKRYIQWTIALPAFLLLAAFPAQYIVAGKMGITLPVIAQVAVFILSVSAGCSLYHLFFGHFLNRFYKAINILAIGLLMTIFVGAFALPQYNAYLGFAELCRDASQTAREKDIDTYYFYKFRSGENMDVYLQQKVEKKAIEALKQLSEDENFILFVREKDLGRDEDLRKFIEHKPHRKVGNYLYVTFIKNETEI